MAKDLVRTVVRLPARHDRPPRLGVVANTYGVLPPNIATLFDGVDLILHAGDVGEESVMTRLQAIAPVIPVAGDYDTRSRFPQHRVLQLNGRSIALTHGHRIRTVSNPLRAFLADERSETRDQRFLDLLRFFPHVDCLVFAHPSTACRIRLDHTLILNPGSVATSAGELAGDGASVAILELGRVIDATIIQTGAYPAGAPVLAPAR